MRFRAILVVIAGVSASGIVFAHSESLGDPDRESHSTSNTTLAQTAGSSTSAEMVYIPGGTFRMGEDGQAEDEGPVHKVTLRPYWIDRTEVTVAQFAEFVRKTGYKTSAEKNEYTRAFNFKTNKWELTDDANWQHPEGPGSEAKPDEPVTQVSWEDATAFASWAGKRLPTEAEWEFAARGRLDGQPFAWGKDLAPGGQIMANYWQGDFPQKNTVADGYAGRAPVGRFAPNGYGLLDMAGNVWEWCADWYAPDYYLHSAAQNPLGPETGLHRGVRGGSFLCAANWCEGYKVAARHHHVPYTGLNNLGLRCVKEASP